MGGQEEGRKEPLPFNLPVASKSPTKNQSKSLMINLLGLLIKLTQNLFEYANAFSN